MELANKNNNREKGADETVATTIRPEVSERNVYHIDRHRYYELKHFCMQYPTWQKEYAELSDVSVKSTSVIAPTDDNRVSDPTSTLAERLTFYSNRIKMVEQAAESTDEVVGKIILKAVVENLSYDKANAKYGVPCCKDTYYILYRKFFWLLSKARG